MATINTIVLPSGSAYEIEDLVARQGKNYVLTYDGASAVGTAIVGEAVVGVPNYVPSGDIEIEHEEVPIKSNLYFSFDSISTYTLSILGIASKPILGVKDISFKGNGVTFKIEEETE